MFEVTFALEIIAAITGLVFFKKINPVIYKALVFFLLITVVNEGLSHYGFYSKQKINKLIVYQLYFLLQLVVIGGIYLIVLSKIQFNKTYFYVFLCLIVISIVLLNMGGLKKLNLNFVTVICTSLIIFSAWYLYHIYNTGDLLNLKSNPIFIFSIGLIIAQFLLLLFVNARRIESFSIDKNRLVIFQTFNTIGNIFYYLCITYSFICTSLYQRRDGI